MAPAKSALSDKRTVSVRLSSESAQRLRVVAARAGVSMGAYLARLWEESPEGRGSTKDRTGGSGLDSDGGFLLQ
jgi:hypothetical protein